MKIQICILLMLVSLSCGQRDAKHEIVLYSSVDEPYVTPLLTRFEKQTGIHVRLVTDTEATKSAALAERIEAEKDHPQADVYWGNEIFHTIHLIDRGILAQPARIGVRARMIVVSTRPEFAALVRDIHGLADLTNPALKGRIGICHLGFGTASGHIAALYVLWGEPRFIDFMKSLRANDVKLLGGNSAVVDQVAAGNLIAGISDNDDINNAISEGRPVAGVLPDQSDGQGALLIPTTIALVNGAPHPDDAKKLIDFLCTPEVEKELIDAQFLIASSRDPGSIKAMNVDYTECARQMRQAIEIALNILQDRGK